MEKKKISFTKWMLIYLCLGFAAIAIVMLILWSFAERFEETQNSAIIKNISEELSSGNLPEDAVRAITDLPGRVQSDQECVDYVACALMNNTGYKLLPGQGSSETMAYALRCGDKEIGRVVLQQEAEKKFGMRGWAVTEKTYDFSSLASDLEITVPGDYEVRVNGAVLGSEWIVEDNIHFDELDEYYDFFSGVPYKVKYSFDNYFGVPAYDVTNSDGESVYVDENTTDEELLNNCSSETLERLKSFTDRFLYRYAIFTSSINDPYAEYGNLAPYVLSGSDFEYRMVQAQDGLSWMQIINYVNVDSSSLISATKFGDNVYFLHMSATITTNNTYNERVTTDNNWKVIVVDNGGDLRVSMMDTY